MTTYVSDDFNRANVTGNPGAPQIGPTPVVLTGVPAIASNVLVGSTSPSVTVWDAGVANVEVEALAATPTVSFSRYGGLVLCAAAANDYIKVIYDGGKIALSRVLPSGEYALAQRENIYGQNTVLLVSHRDGVVRVSSNQVANPTPVSPGPDIIVYTLPPAMAATAPASTRHGIFFAGVGVATYDNLVIRDAPAALVPPTSSALAVVAYEASSPPNPAGFTYRGRDTKTLDISGGA